MSIAVVSAVFGGYDDPVFVEQTIECQYVMVTDGSVNVPFGWRHIPVNIGDMDPRLAGKFVKCRPWEFVDADLIVWLDCSIEPKPGLVEQMIKDLGVRDLAFHPHPDRRSIMSEALFSSDLPKYKGSDVVAQARSYIESGHPDDWSLWAAGLFILRNRMLVREIGQLWLNEICRWTVQDQISLPFVLYQCGVEPSSLSGGLRDNPLFRIRRHSDGT